MAEILIFQRVKSALGGIPRHGKDVMKVESDGPLAEGLGQLGCFPYAEIRCDSFPLDCQLSVGGKPAGTFEKPDVDLILKESTASSFGKGEKTVLDLTYRKGKEIPADKMTIINKGSHGRFCEISEDEISAAMFVGKTIKLKFYKLAVYEKGGHFDWHMDTTHSDEHHATLLLALNTSWEGGDLKLRRNGVETSVDMHPKPDRKGDDVDLKAVAFYTDTDHKVEPVTEGVRIILQYDVEVVGWAYDEDDEIELFETMENTSIKRKRYQKSSDSLTADQATITKVTDAIADLFAGGEKEVAFAMQHLYRKSSILPEYLKGADAQLYRALVGGSYDVTLRPVVLESTVDYYDGRSESRIAVPWDFKMKPSTDSDSDSDEQPAGAGAGGKDTRLSGAKVLHLPMLSAIREISSQEYIEHTGNESQPAEKQYYGAGMFVRQKETGKKQ